MSVTFEEFELKAQPTKGIGSHREYDEQLLFWATGAGGEVGEVLNVVKKMVRDGDSESLDDALVEECGDVLFYLQQILQMRGKTLTDAANAEIGKLAAKRALRRAS